jgi:hypothetical protein
MRSKSFSNETTTHRDKSNLDFIQMKKTVALLFVTIVLILGIIQYADDYEYAATFESEKRVCFCCCCC